MLSSLPSHQAMISKKENFGSLPISSEHKTRSFALSPIDTFEKLVILKKISKAKFPVYLVRSPSSNQDLAMKVYLFKNDQPSVRFKNEIRFAHLRHDNVISIVSYNEEAQEASLKISYVLMEYAPYGDFFDLVMNSPIEWDDKLTRTYFHQLIDGIGYLHSQGIAHMDLKLENLLMGENFRLKIADFDLSHLLVDGKVTTKGTKNYRAPDVLNNTCRDPQAADIYSAGIILFVMRCGGILPYLEGEVYKGIDLHNLMLDKPDIFWEKHIKIQKKSSNFFEQSFKSLVIWMTRADPLKRATLNDIKKSAWYQGPVYSQKELSDLMRQKRDDTQLSL